MALSLADVIAKRQKSVPVDLGAAGTVTVSYSPDKYNRKLLAETDAAANTAESTFLLLTALIKGWDLSDPCTPDAIDSLGFLIQSEILVAITKDANPSADDDPKEPSAAG